MLKVEVGGGRFGGPSLERLVHAFVSAVLLGTAWCDALVSNPELKPPDIEAIEAVNSFEANGAPLSLRMASGRPCSRNRRRNWGLTPSVRTSSGRAATLDIAERRLGPGSVLGALVEEVRDLRQRLPFSRHDKRLVQLKQTLGAKDKRNEIRRQFLDAGGSESQWGKLLSQLVDRELAASLKAAPSKVPLLLELAMMRWPPASASISGSSSGKC